MVFDGVRRDREQVCYFLLPDQATPIGVTARQNAWHGLPRETQQKINRVFANIGKTLDAYQRTR